VIKPARDELLRQAAQGEVLHNDDTGMRVLRFGARTRRSAHQCIHQRIVARVGVPGTEAELASRV
jgi:hypothetical protein